MEGWKTSSCHREFCKRNEQATKILLDSLQLLTFETRIPAHIYKTSSTQLIKMACISINIFKVLLSMQKEKNKRKMLIRFLQHGIFMGYWLNYYSIMLYICSGRIPKITLFSSIEYSIKAYTNPPKSGFMIYN